jgi:dienelactone hydrolase
MKNALLLAACAVLGAGGYAQAQAPTMDMINTTLPEEGAPKAIAGPYAVTGETAFGTAGLKAFRPEKLDRFPRRDTLPVVVWGNGGCAVENPRYAGLLSTIASHGFLVLTTTGTPPPEGAPRRQATVDDLKAAIDWAERENARADSPLKGRIDVKRVAVMGQSCGGVLSIRLGGDPRVGTIGVFNSGLLEADALKALHGPVLLINGHERDFMMERARATYDAIGSLPAFYGARHGAGHTATAYHAGGGEFANVATNWVLWQFKKDRKASAMFAGAKCQLCTDANWDVASKGMEKR